MKNENTTTGAANTTAARHTAGPWEIDGNEIFAKGDYLVARVNANQYTPHSDKRKAVTSHNWSMADQDKANAVLLAAAPELLEACRYFEATLAGLSPAERDALPNEIMNVSALTSVAIAKIEG